MMAVIMRHDCSCLQYRHTQIQARFSICPDVHHNLQDEQQAKSSPTTSAALLTPARQRTAQRHHRAAGAAAGREGPVDGQVQDGRREAGGAVAHAQVRRLHEQGGLAIKSVIV